MSELRAAFPAGSYHLVNQNCNHFASALCERLGLAMPSWVNRLAWLGSFWPFWPEALGRDPSSSGGSTPAPAPAYQAFGGGGQALGTSSVSGGQTDLAFSVDAAAMRELRARAMEARLARAQAPATAPEEDKKSS